MNPPTSNLPRFIPTLTEIVDPANLIGLVDAAKPDVDALVALVQRQIQPILESRLQDEFDLLVRATMSKHWTDVSNRLKVEFHTIIRQAVIDAVGKCEPVKTPE